EFGYCHGVENYSRHLSGRPPGSRPYCLIDYFLYPVRNPQAEDAISNGARDFLIIIDESHVTIPQIEGMYNGDRSRKETLVEYGFRLPSCLDNRPLRFDEFEGLINQVIFVSATPSQYELLKSKTAVEQIIRPTGLVDPQIKVLPTKNQIPDLMKRIKEKAEKDQRTLVSTLTKRMAEELAHFLSEKGLRVKYLHSEFGAFERVKILKELRLGEFDCLVGVNLLREGLDLPEVSLVAILDADKEGFLRSQTSLIQVAGRAARNVDGEIVMYADTKTRSMEKTLRECERRRRLQLGYNRTHHITPTTIKKAIREGIEIFYRAKEVVRESTNLSEDNFDLENVLFELEHEMQLYARNLQFEEAAKVRERIRELLETYGLLEKKSSIKLDATKELLEIIKTRKKGKKYAQHSNRG
ncbi:MAG: excinuclease ABC subunit B, partial [Candidatus Omnitrophica bacterium]|nr:excinuclease ABC subunit B [Candidatus Omnitrophota bacterium]